MGGQRLPGHRAGKIGRLDILDRLGREVLLPEPVAAELLAGPPSDPTRAVVEGGWGTRTQPETIPTTVVEWGLGAGESAVLAVAHARDGAVAVIDDAEARACARAMNLPFTGTLGVVARGFKAGLVAALPDAIDELREAGLFVDDQLLTDVLAWAAKAFSDWRLEPGATLSHMPATTRAGNG